MTKGKTSELDENVKMIINMINDMQDAIVGLNEQLHIIEEQILSSKQNRHGIIVNAAKNVNVSYLVASEDEYEE